MTKRTDTDKQSILKEARDRYKRALDWESTCRSRFKDDIKFDAGDSDNGYQWPEDIRTQRDGESAPCLTINKTHQHTLDVLNDARKSKVAINIRPTGDEATFESAEAMGGLVHYIEYQSRADTAYQNALSFAVRGGWGYCRLATDYVGDDSFDQDIFIRRVKDPLTILLDPDINEFDGSDARFGFVFTDMPRDEFERAYPKLKGKTVGGSEALGSAGDWVTKDYVRVAEYFRCVPNADKLVAYEDAETGVTKIERASKMEADLLKAVIDQPSTMVRAVSLTKVEHFMICGDEIIEEKVWPGKYIPIARCVGEETVIDNELDRKGLVRCLKDAQRMYNYNSSASIQYGALQTKAPWLAATESVENFEEEWANANVQTPAFLPWNALDDDGNQLPQPTRVNPPTSSSVFLEGMRDAEQQMRMVTGQYQDDMGAPSNAISGVAINARQRQGDNATYHYLDHQSIMISYIGRMIIDLIPHVYDTKRLAKMKAENGEETELTIDPNAAQHFVKEQTGEGTFAMILNPSVGKYDVIAEVGPAFATKRQEAFNAYTQILAQNRDLTHIIGDLALKAADFPGAEEAAERLRRMVPAQALGEGDRPDVVALKTQLAQMQKVLELTTAKLADKAGAHQNDQEKNSVSAYKAQTDRVKALQEAWISDPGNVIALVKAALEEALATSGGLAPATDANTPPIEAQPMQLPAPTPPQPPMQGQAA